MQIEQLLDNIIASEKQAQEELWLIPSETLPSVFSRLALSISGVNRYLFKYEYEGQRFCPGTEAYQLCNDFCLEVLKEIYKTKYVSLRPISGMNAMTMILACHSQPGELVYCIDAKTGGHTHTERILDSIGRRMAPIPFHDDGMGWFAPDYEELARQVAQEPPALIYLDPMSYMYQFDLDALRSLAPAQTKLHYDISHVMAFVAAGIYPNAMDKGFNSIGGSTHKTLPGVQKAWFGTDDEEAFTYFEKQSSQMVSALHTSSIVALALALAEVRHFLPEYGRKILDNTLLFARLLTERGFQVMGRQGRPTDCHVLFVSLKNQIDPIEATHRMAQCNVITHPMTLPAPQPVGGIRLGLQELTLLGLEESDFIDLADVFAKVILQDEPPQRHKERIRQIRAAHLWPTSAYVDDERLGQLIKALAPGCEPR